MKLPSDECNWNLLMISLNWIKYWFCAFRLQAITWANVDPDICQHMAPLDHNELRKWHEKWHAVRTLRWHCFLYHFVCILLHIIVQHIYMILYITAHICMVAHIHKNIHSVLLNHPSPSPTIWNQPCQINRCSFSSLIHFPFHYFPCSITLCK